MAVYSLSLKNKAVGMMEAGISPVQVSRTLGMSTRTLRLWKERVRAGKSLEIKPGNGTHSKSQNGSFKIAEKRGQKTRKLAAKLTRSGYPVSRQSVHRYLSKNLNVKPYKPRRIPMLTRKQVLDRVNWCKKRKQWGVEEWKRVIFSDESTFELFHPKNRQNERVWAKNIADVPTSSSVKFPSKVMV